MEYSPRKVALAIVSLDEPWRTNFLEFVVSCADGRWNVDRLPAPEDLRELLSRDARLCRLVVALYCRWTGTPTSDLWPSDRYRGWRDAGADQPEGRANAGSGGRVGGAG